MAKLQLPFEFTSPLTVMVPDPQQQLRPQVVGDFYAKGTGYYDSSLDTAYQINYTLQKNTVSVSETGQTVPLEHWVGNRISSLEDAHRLIVSHLKKLFGLPYEKEQPVKCHSILVDGFLRDRTEGTIDIHYTDNMGKKNTYDAKELEFGQWLVWRNKCPTLSSYWKESSYIQKCKDFALFIADIWDSWDADARQDEIDATAETDADYHSMIAR